MSELNNNREQLKTFKAKKRNNQMKQTNLKLIADGIWIGASLL